MPQRSLFVLTLTTALLLAAAVPLAQIQPPGGGHRPPAEAFNACLGKSTGAECLIRGRNPGTCRDFQGALACIPAQPPGRQGQMEQQRQGQPNQTRQQERQTSQNRPPARPGSTYPDEAASARLKAQSPTPTRGVPDTGQQYCFNDNAARASPTSGRTRNTTAPALPIATTTTGPSPMWSRA